LTDKPLIQALNGIRQPRPPIWLMRQAGRYLPEYRELRSRARDFMDFCYSPDLAVEATLQPIRRFAMDGAIIFSDILVIPHALGQDVRFVEGKGPVLDALADNGAVSALAGTLDRECAAPVYEALSKVRAQLPPATALIGFAGAPWTLATYMIEGGSSRDFARVKEWAYSDAAGFGVLMDKLVDAVTEHLIAQIDAGAEAVQIFDSWAGVLDEDMFRKWCIAPIARIALGVKAAHPSVPVIGFPNRCGALYQAFVAGTGVNAVSIDSSVPVDWAREQLQSRVCVQGNLDPIALKSGGAAMKDAALRILAGLGQGPHVFNLGHGVIPSTPPDHVAELVALVRGSPS
jgi:uroporphyrinogen decarboxylase